MTALAEPPVDLDTDPADELGVPGETDTGSRPGDGDQPANESTGTPDYDLAEMGWDTGTGTDTGPTDTGPVGEVGSGGDDLVGSPRPPRPAGTVTSFLTLAAQQIGTTEQPAGSNLQKYGGAAGQNGVAWCAWFQWWLGEQTGTAIPRTGYTPDQVTIWKRWNRWGTTPRVGALVYFDFPGDAEHRVQHVGVVEKLLARGRIQTIEGNTGAAGYQDNGGAVLRKNRDPVASGVRGYGYPAYRTGAMTLRGILRLAGTDHPAISALQLRLNDLGQHLVVDGDFGPRTRAAVMALQRARHLLPVDGEVGPDTCVVLGWTWAG